MKTLTERYIEWLAANFGIKATAPIIKDMVEFQADYLSPSITKSFRILSVTALGRDRLFVCGFPKEDFDKI